MTFKNDFYYLDFPSRKPKAAKLPVEIESSLNIQPQEIYKARDYMLVYENEHQIKDIKVNRHFFDQINLGFGGVIVTAAGDKTDFVSRFFTPQATILEDPVTGSSHSTLAPYWAKIFDKNILKAYQASKRGGELWLEVRENRVMIEGEAVTVITGKINF